MWGQLKVFESDNSSGLLEILFFLIELECIEIYPDLVIVVIL